LTSDVKSFCFCFLLEGSFQQFYPQPTHPSWLGRYGKYHGFHCCWVWEGLVVADHRVVMVFHHGSTFGHHSPRSSIVDGHVILLLYRITWLFSHLIWFKLFVHRNRFTKQGYLIFAKCLKQMSLISNFIFKCDFLNKFFAGFDKSWEHLFLQCGHPGEIIVKGKILAQCNFIQCLHTKFEVVVYPLN